MQPLPFQYSSEFRPKYLIDNSESKRIFSEPPLEAANRQSNQMLGVIRHYASLDVNLECTVRIW